MRRLILFALLLFTGYLQAQTRTTVTGTVQSPSGSLAASGYVEFRLQPPSTSTAFRISGSTFLAPQTARCGINTSGQVKDLALTGSCLVWGNDLILPANTYYTIAVAPANVVTSTITKVLISGTAVDLSSPTFAPNVNLVPTYQTITVPPINTNIIPGADNVFTLGSDTKRFANAYINNLNAGVINGLYGGNLPVYTYATLPAASTPGRLAKLSDNDHGIWMDIGTQWVPTNVVNVRNFGAAGNGTTDDTTAWTNAINSGAAIIDGAGATYKLSTVVSVTVSNVEIRNAKFVVPRPAADGINPYKNYAFYISGVQAQTNVTWSNVSFSGSGYWGGLRSSILYFNNSWGGGGYPNVDTANYTTTRTKFLVTDTYFDTPYYEAIFLTNVQCDLSRVKVYAAQNNTNNAGIIIRATQDIHIDRILMDSCKDKSLSVTHVKGATISDTDVVNGTYTSSIDDSLACYVGYWSQDINISNFRDNSPGGGGFKASYYAQNVHLSNCIFNSAGNVMFQGVRGGSIIGGKITSSSKRSLWFYYSSAFTPDMDNDSIIVSGVNISSTESGADAPLIVDLSNASNSSLVNCTVSGNIYARPARDLSIRNNDISFASAYATPTKAIFLQDFNGVKIRGNRIATTHNTYTIQLLGDSAAAAAEIVDNIINRPATATAVYVGYCASGVFIYKGNIPYGLGSGSELYHNYTDASQVQVFQTDLIPGLRVIRSDNQTQLLVYSTDAGGSLRTYPNSGGKFGLEVNCYYSMDGYPYTRTCDLVALANTEATDLRFLTKNIGADATVGLQIDGYGHIAFGGMTPYLYSPFVSGDLPVYADVVTAKASSVPVGAWFRTALGVLMIVTP